MATDAGPDYAAVFDTVKLPECTDLRATISAGSTDWRDTLRSTLPQLPLQTGANGQFQLAQELGRGAMGVVHLAHQAALGRDVAIKTVAADRGSREAENALLQEARVMGLVEHPNVVPVHIIGQDEQGRPVIVMKRVDGTTWSDFLDGKVELESDDPEAFHLSVVLAICRALSFAHDREILHRDVKPENVMIGRFGEVYLVDWGLAASLSPDSHYVPFIGNSDAIVGTPAYMAPEMTAGRGTSMGRHTDIFLVGAVLFHAVTGSPPNRGSSLFDVLAFAYEGRPRIYPRETSDELRAICERAMAHVPGERFESVDQLRAALEAYLAHRNSHALVATAQQRLSALEAAIVGNDPGEIHRAFGEARFGFTAALQIWEQNAAATEGLQRCLVTMIEHELTRNQVSNARALYGQLPAADEALAARIDELERSLGEREAKLAKLAYDYDENVGVDARRWIVGVMAVIFATSPVLLRLIEGLEVPTALRGLTDDPVLLAGNAFGLAFIPLLLGFSIWTRPRLRRHKASRIFLRGLTFMYVLGYGARTSSLWGGAPLYAAAAAETAIFASGLMMLGLSVDRRLFASGVCFALASPTLLLAPAHTVDIYSAAATLACLIFLGYDALLRREN